MTNLPVTAGLAQENGTPVTTRFLSVASLQFFTYPAKNWFAVAQKVIIIIKFHNEVYSVSFSGLYDRKSPLALCEALQDAVILRSVKTPTTLMDSGDPKSRCHTEPRRGAALTLHLGTPTCHSPSMYPFWRLVVSRHW